MGVPVITNSQNYIDIANAIREKTGKDLTYKPTQLAHAIEEMNVTNLSEYVGILPPEIAQVGNLGDSTKIFYGIGYVNANNYYCDLDTLTSFCIYNRITHQITLREQVSNPRTSESTSALTSSTRLTNLYHFVYIQGVYTTSKQNEFYVINKEDGSWMRFSDIEPNYTITAVSVLFSTYDKAVIKINNSKIAILDNDLHLEYVSDGLNYNIFNSTPYVDGDFSYYALAYAGIAGAIIFKHNDLTNELTYTQISLPVSVIPVGMCDGYFYLNSQSDASRYIYMVDLVRGTVEPKYPLNYSAYSGTTSLYSVFQVYDNFIYYAYYRTNNSYASVIISRDPNLNYIKNTTNTNQYKVSTPQMFVDAAQYINGTLEALVIENGEVVSKTCNMWGEGPAPTNFVISSWPGIIGHKWYYYCFVGGYAQQQRETGMGIFVYDFDTNAVTQLATGNDFVHPDYMSQNVQYGTTYGYQLDEDKYYLQMVNQYMTPGIAVINTDDGTCAMYNTTSNYYISNMGWNVPSNYFTNTNEHLKPYITPIRLFTMRHITQTSDYRLGILSPDNFVISSLPTSNNSVATTSGLYYYYPRPDSELYTGELSNYSMSTQALKLVGTKYLLSTSITSYYCIYDTSNNVATWYPSISVPGSTLVSTIGNYHMIKVDPSIENVYANAVPFSQEFEHYRKKGNIVFFGYFKCPESYNKHYQAGTSYMFGYNTVTGDIVVPSSLRNSNVYMDFMNPTDDDTIILVSGNKLYSYKISTDALTDLLPGVTMFSNTCCYRHSNGDVYYSTSNQNLLVYKAALGTSTTLISSTYYNYGFLYNGSNNLLGLTYRYGSNYYKLRDIDLETYTTREYYSGWANGDINSVTISKDYIQLPIYSSTGWIIDKKTWQRGSFSTLAYIRQLISTDEERSYLVSYSNYYVSKLTFRDDSVTSTRVPNIQAYVGNSKLQTVTIDGEQYKSTTTPSPTSSSTIYDMDMTEIVTTGYCSSDLKRRLEINGNSVVLASIVGNNVIFSIPVTIAMSAGNTSYFYRSSQYQSYRYKYWCPCSSKGNTYLIWMGED